PANETVMTSAGERVIENEYVPSFNETTLNVFTPTSSGICSDDCCDTSVYVDRPVGRSVTVSGEKNVAVTEYDRIAFATVIERVVSRPGVYVGETNNTLVEPSQ